MLAAIDCYMNLHVNVGVRSGEPVQAHRHLQNSDQGKFLQTHVMLRAGDSKGKGANREAVCHAMGSEV